MTSVRKTDLGKLTEIAKGGEGVVYRIQRTPRGIRQQVAYKELRSDLNPRNRSAAQAAMQAAVAFRDSLPADDRRELDEFTAWPLALVNDDDGVCGLLMPLLDDAFFVRSADGPKVFELQWLCATEQLCRKKGIDISPVADLQIRMALLAQLVYAIGRLHRLGIVYGDVSLRNAALALDPPRIKLLDCDATSLLTNTSRRQGNSPFFQPPEYVSGGLQDDRSDVYKLALCIVRGLQFGRGITQAKEAKGLTGVLDPVTVALVERALNPDPVARPRSKDLFQHLTDSLAARTRPPVVQSLSLSRSAVFRGGEIVVTWQVSGAQSVQIIGPNGAVVPTGPPGEGIRTAGLRPTASGAVRLVARNRNGTVNLIAGQVDLHDVPPFELPQGWLTELRPHVPALPPITALAEFPMPAIETEDRPIPRIDLPQVHEAIERINPGWAPSAAVARLDATVQASAGSIRDRIDRVQHDAADLAVDVSHSAFAEAGRDVEAALDDWRRALLAQSPSGRTI